MVGTLGLTLGFSPVFIDEVGVALFRFFFFVNKAANLLITEAGSKTQPIR